MSSAIERRLVVPYVIGWTTETDMPFEVVCRRGARYGSGRTTDLPAVRGPFAAAVPLVRAIRAGQGCPAAMTPPMIVVGQECPPAG
jgi:hypothetical protein